MCTATQWCIPYTYRGYVKKTPPWQRLRGIVVLIQKLSPNSSCGIMIWIRVVPLQNVHAVFVSILRHRKDEVRLLIERGGTEKNSLFIIRLGYWVMTSHPQVPITGLLTWLCSRREAELIYYSHSAPVLVTEYFVIISLRCFWPTNA